MADLEDRALAALDADALVRDAAALVRTPSVTGSERAAIELVVERARALGLAAELVEHDLDAVRGAPGYPGQEAARDELVGAVVRVPGSGAGPRLCIDAHVDVVTPGAEPWSRDPWSGALEDGRLHGRGAADMKGAVAA